MEIKNSKNKSIGKSAIKNGINASTENKGLKTYPEI